MKQTSRSVQYADSAYVIALTGADWLLYDTSGAYLGTVVAPREGLVFGCRAPTVLLRKSAFVSERIAGQTARVAAELGEPTGSREPEPCSQRL